MYMTKTTDNISAVFGELLGLAISVLANLYLLPILPFVTKEFSVWLPIGITVAVISTIFDIARIVGNKKYYHGLRSLSLAAETYSVFKLLQIFPFDFSLTGFGSLNSLVRFALGVSVFGMGAALIIHIVKFGASVCKVETEEVKATTPVK